LNSWKLTGYNLCSNPSSLNKISVDDSQTIVCWMTSFAGIFRVRAEKLPFRRLNPSVQEFQNTNIKLPALYANHNGLLHFISTPPL
jgi:hypothetical protein